jgi:predicted HAD superfamily Cof-like phosphohydrolase
MDALKSDDIENLAKELCDLIYVILGTAISYGIPLDKCFDEVHKSNMSKLDENGKPLYREDGKILKSKLYRTADIKSVLGL